jgi:hypothetical protein
MTDDEIRKLLEEQAAALSRHLVEMEKALAAPEGALTTLPAQDDWSCIIKCHALIEGAVTGMLSAALDQRLRHIFNILELGREGTGKLEFAKALDMLTPEQRRFVRELSRIRNLLAHDLRHLAFTIPNYINAMNRDQRRRFITSLCWGLDPKKGDEWFAFVNNNPKAGILSATIRLINHALSVGEIAAIDKDESQAALKDMISGTLRYEKDFDTH